MQKIITSRRTLIAGLASFVAAPAIVRASSLMKVKTPEDVGPFGLEYVGLPDISHVDPAFLRSWRQFRERVAYEVLMGDDCCP